VKIQTIQVDGFGIWSGLELAGIGEGLSVVFGPNEAGKTTLLELVRAVLYGFSPSRRRYLPPQHGGPAGGWLVLDTPEGLFRVGRHLEGTSVDAQERLRVVDGEGQACEPHVLDELLFAVDEQTFDHVFAVGLRELQYLGTLDESRAAALLYNLSIAVDGVNLPDVIAQLTHSRNQILDAAGGSCQLARLLDQRQRLCDQLEQLGNTTRRYERLAQELRRIDEQLARIESQQAQCRHQARLVDLAIGLRERWAQQQSIEEQLEAIGPVPEIPRRVAERLDQVGSRLSAEQERLGRLDAERAELREQYRALPVNKPVRRRAETIRALADQRPRLVALREQVGALRSEIDRLEEELHSRRRQLGFDPQSSSSLPHGARQVLRQLRGPASLMRAAYERWQEAAAAAAEAQQRAEQLARQLPETLGETESADLQARLERTSELVGRLRRRAQLDERIEQMAAHRGELEAQARTLAQNQMLPGWILAGLGVVFVVGMVLILVGLLMPESITGPLGWALALLGLGGAGLAGLGKVLLERSAAARLEACQMQLRMLQGQMEQARNEREEIDRRLQTAGVVLSGGAIQTRLAEAEQELANLEAAVPLQTRLASATQQAEAATRRAEELKKDYARARRQWRQALAGAGLPERLSPRKLRAWLRRAERLEPLEHRLAMRREDLQQREQELQSLAQRIGQLAAELQLQEAPCAEEQLDRLWGALEDEQRGAAKRRELRRKYREVSRARSRCEQAIRRLTALRRRLLRTCGVRSEEQLRELAVRAARVEVLRKERDELDKAMREAIGRPEDEPEVRRLLEDTPAADELLARREQIRGELERVEAERARRYEQRGRLAEQMEALAADRSAADKQLELSRIEQHIAQAARRWQVLALGSRIFDDLKRHYQKHRQPETLLEASNYLARLTEGRYLRVWTPLDRDVLLVDTADGESRPVEALSRGTREQLFLGLRLAVAACYARRGMPLPLVLDDVLVNFDAQRAKAAAGVLRQFAQSGRQVLLFTCHEHLMKMFKSLKVPIAVLPDSASAPAGKVEFVSTGRSTSKQTKARRSSAAKANAGQPPAAEAAGDESASDEAAGHTAAQLRPLKVDQSSDVLPPPPPVPEGTAGDRPDDEPTVRNERVA